MAEHQQARTKEQDSRQYERRTPDSQKRLKPHRIATTGLLMLLPHVVDETASNDRCDSGYCQWRAEHLGRAPHIWGATSNICWQAPNIPARQKMCLR